MQSFEKISQSTTEYKIAENTQTMSRFWRLLGLLGNKLNLSQWSYLK